jgi:hypothetical protein
MRLTELDPSWRNNGTVLRFDCPLCRDQEEDGVIKRPHGVRIERGVWEFHGTEFTTLTVRPSIQAEDSVCRLHIQITDGEVTFA